VIKKIFRYLLYLVFGFIDFIVLYATLAVTLPYARVHSGQAFPGKGVIVYVQSNGIHTDFVMPVKTSQVNWNNYFTCN